MAAVRSLRVVAERGIGVDAVNRWWLLIPSQPWRSA
jgi:hypothetical protein